MRRPRSSRHLCIDHAIWCVCGALSTARCPPLFQAVLEKHLIIPLDSPRQYPRYNGAMEHAQGEIKGVHRVGPELAGVALMSHSAAAHTLNHRRRPSLKGQTACAVFESRHEA